VVNRATGRPAGEVSRAVRYGLDHGLLRYRSGDGVCTWEFADSAESLLVTEVVRQPPTPLGARLPQAEMAAAV
jgi:hypothetical protein